VTRRLPLPFGDLRVTPKGFSIRDKLKIIARSRPISAASRQTVKSRPKPPPSRYVAELVGADTGP
jgi:hypothetical protein